MVVSSGNGNNDTKLNAPKLQRNHTIRDTFLLHLNEYGLILIDISNKNNESSTYNHPQYNDGYIFHKNNLLFELHLCVGYDLGLGNILSKYWGAFAISFFLNYNFKWSLCASKSKLAVYHSKQKYFSSFLPKYYENNINQTSKGNVMILANRNKYHTSYIHPCSLAFVYYNKYIAPYTTNQIYNGALASYYKFNNKPIPVINTSSDIVIHYRCGNIIHLSGNNPRYGLLTTNFIKYSVKNIYNKSKITSSTSIYIISQLSKNSLRTHERKSMKDCDYLINYIVNNSLTSFFQPGHIEIVYDTDVNDDYYRMINAKLLICSPSSFCFMAAIANKNGYVIMPSYGPWIDLNDITNISKNYSDYYSSDLIIKHSKLLPPNHIIVETLQTGWHTNRYSDYSKKTEYNLKNLSQYLAFTNVNNMKFINDTKHQLVTVNYSIAKDSADLSKVLSIPDGNICNLSSLVSKYEFLSSSQYLTLSFFIYNESILDWDKLQNNWYTTLKSTYLMKFSYELFYNNDLFLNHPNRVYNIKDADIIFFDFETMFQMNWPNYGAYNHREQNYVKRPQHHYSDNKQYKESFKQFIFTFSSFLNDNQMKQYLIFMDAEVPYGYFANLSNIIRVSVGHNVKWSKQSVDKTYDPLHDISLPTPLQSAAIPRNYTGCNNYQNYKYLAIFQGRNMKVSGHHPASVKNLRSKMNVSINGYDYNDIVFNVKEGRKGEYKHNYQDLVCYTWYMFSITGNGPWNFRLIESIANNKIPIIVTNGWVLPFNDIIDWNCISVQINETFDWENNFEPLYHLLKSDVQKRIQIKQMIQFIFETYLKNNQQYMISLLYNIQYKINVLNT